jgi:hypothetical protein
MEKETFFIYDPSYEDENKLYRKLNLMLDEEERAKTKFMKNFMLALMKTSK